MAGFCRVQKFSVISLFMLSPVHTARHLIASRRISEALELF